MIFETILYHPILHFNSTGSFFGKIGVVRYNQYTPVAFRRKLSKDIQYNITVLLVQVPCRLICHYYKWIIDKGLGNSPKIIPAAATADCLKRACIIETAIPTISLLFILFWFIDILRRIEPPYYFDLLIIS